MTEKKKVGEFKHKPAQDASHLLSDLRENEVTLGAKYNWQAKEVMQGDKSSLV